jgi:hypothetical protein
MHAFIYWIIRKIVTKEKITVVEETLVLVSKNLCLKVKWVATHLYIGNRKIRLTMTSGIRLAGFGQEGQKAVHFCSKLVLLKWLTQKISNLCHNSSETSRWSYSPIIVNSSRTQLEIVRFWIIRSRAKIGQLFVAGLLNANCRIRRTEMYYLANRKCGDVLIL